MGWLAVALTLMKSGRRGAVGVPGFDLNGRPVGEEDGFVISWWQWN